MTLLKTVHVGMSPLTLALEVFAATQAGIGVQVIETDGTYLLKVEVKHMPLYLAEVRTLPLRPLPQLNLIGGLLCLFPLTLIERAQIEIRLLPRLFTLLLLLHLLHPLHFCHLFIIINQTPR